MAKNKERKTICAVVLSLLLCLGSFGLWGCTDDATHGDTLEEEIPRMEQDGFYSVTKNNLILTTSDYQIPGETEETLPPAPEEGVSYAEDCQVYQMSAVVSGLKDKEIEKAIQEKIDKAFTEINVDVRPPYRGIRLSVPDGSEIIWKTVNISQEANFGNILSLRISKFLSYAIPDDSGRIEYELHDGYKDYKSTVTVGQEIPLNIDLNTGNDITLKEVFRNGSDYMSLVNDLTKEYLDGAQGSVYYDYYGGIEPIGPFKGLKENQKFSISDWGLNLIFDEDTPEFDVQKNPMSITLDYSRMENELALGTRFFDEKGVSLFTDETIIKSLIQDTASARGNQRNSREVYVNPDQPEQGTLYINIAYPSGEDFPQKVKDTIVELSQEDEQMIDKLKEDLAKKADWGDKYGNSAYYEKYISATKVGTYISIDVYSYNSLDEYGDNRKMCFDRFSGEEIQLEDIFLDSVTQEKQDEILKNGIKKYLEQNQWYGNNISPEDDSAIHIMLQAIKGFSLGTEGLFLCLDPDTLREMNKNMDYNLYIPYSDLGCEYLAIFQ